MHVLHFETINPRSFWTPAFGGCYYCIALSELLLLFTGCLLLHETSHVRATQRLKKIVKVEWNSGTWRRVCVPDYLSCPETQIKGGLRRNNPCTLLTEIAATSVGDVFGFLLGFTGDSTALPLF